jgi:hypothetical protein
LIKLSTTIFFAATTAAATASGSADAASDVVETLRASCQYEIGASKDVRFLGFGEEASTETSKRLTAKFQLTVRGKSLNGTMTFVCPKTADAQGINAAEVSSASDPGSFEVPLSPKALIESEDAGGRYARIVAWQRRLPSKLWSADVAYVTSVMGDGHREPVNQFLVCGKAVAKPCITAELDQRTTLTSSQQEGVLKLLGGIRPRPAAALRPTGKQ